jgi:small-conductance mechanosensitive channel
MDFFSKWQDTLINVSNQFIERLGFYLPNVIGAFLLLLIGWLIAHILKVVAIRLTKLTEHSLPKIFPTRSGLPSKFPSASAKILGSVIFWVVILFFLTAATQVLGLNTFTTWLAKVVDYLPTVFVGILIIIAGFLISQFAREFVIAAAASAGDRQKELLGRVVQSSILIIATLVGAEQIGIKVTFLVILAVIIGISLVGTVAIALSLGARDYVANLIGGHYLKQRYNIGQLVRIANYEGRILEITETAIIIDTLEGRASIPAKVFNEQAIILLMSPHHG